MHICIVCVCVCVCVFHVCMYVCMYVYINMHSYILHVLSNTCIYIMSGCTHVYKILNFPSYKYLHAHMLYICMRLCMCVYVCVCVCCVRACVGCRWRRNGDCAESVHAYMRLYMYSYVCICVHTSIYVCISLYVFTSIYVCIRLYMYAYTCDRSHACIRIVRMQVAHISTHTPQRSLRFARKYLVRASDWVEAGGPQKVLSR